MPKITGDPQDFVCFEVLLFYFLGQCYDSRSTPVADIFHVIGQTVTGPLSLAHRCLGNGCVVVKHCCGQLLQTAQGYNKIFGPLLLIDVVTAATGGSLLLDLQAL